MVIFKDNLCSKEGEEIDFDSHRNVTLDRQTLYCVPIPGENEWVRKVGQITLSTRYTTLPEHVSCHSFNYMQDNRKKQNYIGLKNDKCF